MNTSTLKIKRFQDKVFSYYKRNKRDLPWRKTKDLGSTIFRENIKGISHEG